MTGYVNHPPEGVAACLTSSIGDIQFEVESARYVVIVEPTRAGRPPANLSEININVPVANIPKGDVQIRNAWFD